MDVLGADIVVTSQQEDNFGLVGDGLELDSKFEGIDFSLAPVEDVESVPAFFLAHEAEFVTDLFGFLQH